MKGRKIVFGDIHGCYEELINLLAVVNPTKADTLIFLGDYIDRGPNSKAVLDTIIELKEVCNVIALLGNHEAMMRDAFTEKDLKKRMRMIWVWCQNGGVSTTDSYMYDFGNLLDISLESEVSQLIIPPCFERHLEFIKDLPTYYIDDTHIFVHASPYLDEAIQEQSEEMLIWRRASSTDRAHGYKHVSGKTIVSGHTAQLSGIPIALSDKNIIIDSGCYFTGWITAMDVTNNSFIQASKTEHRTLSYEQITKHQ